MVQLLRAGRPITLTQEIIDRILVAVPKLLVPSQIAYNARILPQRLSEWLKWGLEDIDSGQNSIFAQLAENYYAVRSQAMLDKIEKLGACPKNYGALTWILEKCFKEEFEAKSEYVKMLEDVVFEKLPKYLQGGNHGEKVDSEGYQTSGGFTQAVECADGKENPGGKDSESGQF